LRTLPGSESPRPRAQPSTRGPAKSVLSLESDANGRLPASQINELVKAHLELHDPVDLNDLVAKIVESAAELIPTLPRWRPKPSQWPG